MAGLNTKTGQRGVTRKSYELQASAGQWQEGKSPAYSADQQFANMGRMNQMANQQRNNDMSAMAQAAKRGSLGQYQDERIRVGNDMANKGYMDGIANQRQVAAQQRDLTHQRQSQTKALAYQNSDSSADRASRERMNRENNASQLMSSMMNAASGAGGGGGWRWW